MHKSHEIKSETYVYKVALHLPQHLPSPQHIPQTGIHHTQEGVILEIEGRVCQKYKRASFLYQKSIKITSDFSNTHVHSIFPLFLIKHIFEKNKSLMAVSKISSLQKYSILGNLSNSQCLEPTKLVQFNI